MTTDWPRQPDRRTCGPSVLVVAQELATGRPGPWTDFEPRVLAMHRRVNRWWPRALGTTPRAVARELGDRRVAWVRTSPGAGFDRALAAVRAGELVPMYVGSRWLPRHVVLALGESASGGLRCYEPSRGHVVDVDRAEVTRRRLRLAGWAYLWCVVTPG